MPLERRDCSSGTLAEYEARWRLEIGEEFFDSVRIQRRVSANPPPADRILRAAAVDRGLCRPFARFALGEESMRRRKLEMTWRFSLASLRARVRPLRSPFRFAQARRRSRSDRS